jgi:exopolysaccharide production protein ExoQ
MKGAIALIVWISYVVILLFFEREKNPRISRSSWIPTIWMLLVASKPLALWLGSNDVGSESSLIDQVFLSIMLVLGLFCLMRKPLNWKLVLNENKYILLIVAFMLVSIIWSRIPIISMKRWMREIIAVVMGFVILIDDDPKEAVVVIFRRVAIILIPLSLVLIKYFPQYGVEYGRWSGEKMWVGAALQKNGLGRLSMIAAFLYIWSFFRSAGERQSVRRRFIVADFSILIISLYLLKSTPGSYSATGLVSFAVGIALLVLLAWTKKKRIRLPERLFAWFAVMLIAFAVTTVMVGGKSISSATSALGRDTTLTGRTDVWGSLVPVFLKKPIIGTGFGSFWTARTRFYFEIPDAHSGYLDILLELGLVGMAVFAMFIAALMRISQKAIQSDFYWASFGICFTLIALVHNISESSFNSFSSHITASLLFIAIASSKAHEEYTSQTVLRHHREAPKPAT